MKQQMQRLMSAAALGTLCATGALAQDKPVMLKMASWVPAQHALNPALVAWGVSMTTRQVGHFFFEPKGYDHINDASFEFKEAVKVGYNLKRKVVLLGIWAALPGMLLIDPTFLNYLQPHQDAIGFAINVGWLWFWLGVTGALFRVAQLTVTQSLETGVVWLIKIITDPLHDIKLYWSSPIHLLKGQIIDPEHGKQHF